jgi:hypothetical protein
MFLATFYYQELCLFWWARWRRSVYLTGLMDAGQDGGGATPEIFTEVQSRDMA